MIMELGLVLIVAFAMTFRSMQRRAAAVSGEAGTVATDTGGGTPSAGARTAAIASLACALLLPTSLLLPPIPFHLELQPFVGIILGVLAIVRLGNRFASRWQMVAWLGVGLSVTCILLVFAAFALMLYE